MKLGNLVNKLLGFVGARFLGAGLGLVTQIVLARMLPQADVGIVLMGMSTAAFVSLATHGGYALLAFTQLPRLISHGRGKLTRAFHQVVLTDTVVWSALMFLLLYIASQVFHFSDAQNTAWLFGCICSPASSLMRYDGVIASSNRRFELSYLPDFVARPLLFLTGLLLLKVTGQATSPINVLILFVAVAYAVALGQAFILGRMGVTPRDFGWPRSSLAKPVRSRAMSLVIVSAVMLAFADIVTITASWLLPEADVAVVGLTMRLAALAGFILQAGQSFILPDYTAAVMKRDWPMANAILMRLNGLTLAVIGASLVGAFLLGHYALLLFGQDYVKGWWLLILLMLGQSIRALGGMNQHILSMEGQQLRTAGACVLALLVLFGAAYLCCRAYGFVGMGYAVLCAEATWLVALGIMAEKRAGRRGDLLWLLRQPK